VPLPGGTFTMGADGPESLPEDGEGPPREVTLRPFAIAATAVTNAEFARFVAATGHVTAAERAGWSSVFYAALHPAAADHVIEAADARTPWWLMVRGATWRAPFGPGSDLAGMARHPVVHVAWDDAAAYAAWCGLRLPTEAEWEYAARGGLATARYPWGDALTPGGRHMCNIWQGAFPRENDGADGWLATCPVRSFPPNGWGLFEMAGNVWEWCADRWSVDWHRGATRKTRVDPRGPEAGEGRVVRGGSYLCHAGYCHRYRVSARLGQPQGLTTGHIGFRCAGG
jgi:formylglycine-generating enzyme required for sulfatase activity